MSPPPYTTMPLHPLCTASTGLTFLHQRQCPHHHIPLFHCILCPLHTASTGLTFLYQRQCPSHHIPLFHCIHCVTASITSTGLTILHQRTMSPPPYTTIPLHTVSPPPHITIALCSASTASTGLTFLHQKQCPHHIPLFQCIHCILHPLRPHHRVTFV